MYSYGGHMQINVVVLERKTEKSSGMINYQMSLPIMSKMCGCIQKK